MELRRRLLPATRRGRAALGGAALFLGLLIFLLAFPGCQLRYLRRQAMGTWRVLRGRVAIDDALLAKVTPAQREKLLWVARVREFASKELGLETGKAYTAYYDTGGQAITTVVVASHPLALLPYRWKFPITGEVPYLGHYRPEEARAERDRLRAEGFDTALYPVSAFSTLGWIDDPVLSTMLELTRGELADLLIHELTHRTVFFAGDSDLNESLAEWTASEGTRRLLESEGAAGAAEFAACRSREGENELRDGIHERLERDLDALYRSRLTDEAKLARKKEILEGAARVLEGPRNRRRPELSNAILAIDRAYRGLLPTLRAAAASLGGHPREVISFLKGFKSAKEARRALAARFRSSPPPAASTIEEPGEEAEEDATNATPIESQR